MKKTLLISILMIFISFEFFANENSFFTPEVSLGSGISIYDDSSDTNRKAILTQSDYKRVVVGITVDTNLNISDSIKVIAGGEFFGDFTWDKGIYYHTADYAFFSGIKIFPDIKGLSFSISYTLGNRSDFYSTRTERQIPAETQTNSDTPAAPDSSDSEDPSVPDSSAEENTTPAETTPRYVTVKNKQTKSWGNGFRIAVQYDFMEDRNYKVKPHIGAYYRCVPRGNYKTDHILSIYGGVRF